MNILPHINSADAKKMRRQGEFGFTMVEIAIAIGVIGFALVAIIGILPRGMNLEKDTHGYTIVGQDAQYFLDAIRNGAAVSNNNGANILIYPSAQSLDFLTNYVQSVQYNLIINGTNAQSTTYAFTNGAAIIGLISTPQNNYNSPNFASNYFYYTLTCRALSGPATEVNVSNSLVAFSYKVDVMVIPYNTFAAESTNFNEPGLDVNESNIAYNAWLEATPGAGAHTATAPVSTADGTVWVNASGQASTGAGALLYNMYYVRLRFSWPLQANGSVGNGQQTYCTLVSGQLAEAPVSAGGVPLNGWFFQPQIFNGSPPTNL